MWFKESNSYFCKIENFAYGEINEQSFSNPHPWWLAPAGVRSCAAQVKIWDLIKDMHIKYNGPQTPVWNFTWGAGPNGPPNWRIWRINSSDAGDGILRPWGSLPCLLMLWLLKSPEHQQVWYWLCQTTCIVVPELIPSDLVGSSQIKGTILKWEHIFCDLLNN